MATGISTCQEPGSRNIRGLSYCCAFVSLMWWPHRSLQCKDALHAQKCSWVNLDIKGWKNRFSLQIFKLCFNHTHKGPQIKIKPDCSFRDLWKGKSSSLFGEQLAGCATGLLQHLGLTNRQSWFVNEMAGCAGNQLEKENWQQLRGCQESDWCLWEAVSSSTGLSAGFVK